MTPASQPGVARCSLRSQTFARPSLQYCGHCTSLKNDISVVKTTFWQIVIWHIAHLMFFYCIRKRKSVEKRCLDNFLAYCNSANCTFPCLVALNPNNIFAYFKMSVRNMDPCLEKQMVNTFSYFVNYSKELCAVSLSDN